MKLLEDYIEARQNLFKHFDYKGFAKPIEDQLDNIWVLEGNVIRWGDESVEEYDTGMVRDGVYRKEDQTLIETYDSLMVFSNDNEQEPYSVKS